MSAFYHGGIRDMAVGDVLVPSPPHVYDGCPICLARESGRTPTVGLLRGLLRQRMSDPRAQQALQLLEGEPDDAPLDPPSEAKAVYVTSDIEYATWYAARSGNGALYRVEPIGPLVRSQTDHFPSWHVESARVVQVLRRRVVLDRTERRSIMRRWKKADEKFARTMSERVP